MSIAKAISTSIDVNPEAKTAAAPLAKRLNRIVMLVAALFLLNATMEFSAQSRQTKLLEIGDKIPPYSLSLLGGGEITGKSLAGKPTIYFFFANWCPCSHTSVQRIKQASAQYAKDGLQTVFIGVQDSTSNLEKFARKHKLESLVNVSGGETFAASVGIKTTPTTVFSDRKGVIRSIFIGKVERYDQLKGGLESILLDKSREGSAV
ncbi:MAG TPA: TlpA family protein disulfide reductase [Nitrospirae bacterium]|nr:TlpA family protein disulfide reductase [Nitrospirota bacterium]